MTKPLPRTPDAETIEQWRETRDLFKAAVGDSYDEQIEPFREVIRKQCGTLISPYRLLIEMSPKWVRMPEEKKMATIAATFDVHEEREQGRAG